MAHRTAAAALAVLLLVPLVLRGHDHGSHAPGGRACATCVAVHHSPALTAPLAAVHGPRVHAVPVVVAPVSSGARPARLVRAGRAPPVPPVRAV